MYSTNKISCFIQSVPWSCFTMNTLAQTASVNWVELGVNARISPVSSNKAKETTMRNTIHREKISLRGTQGWKSTSKHVMCLGFEHIWSRLKTEIRKGTKFFLLGHPLNLLVSVASFSEIFPSGLTFQPFINSNLGILSVLTQWIINSRNSLLKVSLGAKCSAVF